MIDHKVWRKVQRMEMPVERSCVKCKWIFEVKRNGVFRARLVACGYSQVPGMDFTEVYSPVVNDVTIRILFVTEMVWNLESRLLDVETAFLHGELKEEIYMDCPEGLEHNEGECLLLIKTLYGLVQSGRYFYKKLIEVLKSIGFTQSLADPCLLMKRDVNGIVYLALWVDDIYAQGHKDALDKLEEDLKKHFQIKVETTLKDYLSCEVIFDKEKTKCWVGQPHLMKKLLNTFETSIRSLQSYKTPGTPGQGITIKKGEYGVPLEFQKRYRTGVGMLLYLVKYSRPDISNAVRELSKGMKLATPAAYKEMLRVIKYVTDTKDLGLKLEPNREESKDSNWDLVVYSDSDWAGDKDNRLSVSGYIVYLYGCPIMWKSRQQKTLALSSSEAELYACADAAKEIRFIANILITMEIPVKLPITVRVDNIGAIFMAENVVASARTKHTDLRAKFITQYIDEGFIKIIFVRSEENLSDGFTKNVSGDIFERHTKTFMGKKSGKEN